MPSLGGGATMRAMESLHPLPDEVVELVALRFRVLAEPTRIRLLEHLRDGEASVLELAEAVGGSEQNVSKHLGVLRQAGVVARRKHGNFAYYRIVDEGVLALCEAVCSSLRIQVAALGRAVAGAGV
jgi:DNA-binding transcriptional ArsR family regulator